MSKSKKRRHISYSDFIRTHDEIPQPKGKFVNLFKVMRDRQAAERAVKAARPHKQSQTPSSRQTDTAAHTHTETNPMPKNKKRGYISYSDFIRTHDEIPQPKGKFVNPFKAMRDGWAEAEREADAARARRQGHTSE